MMMKKLPPIPSPPALRWREARIRILPVMVFAAGVVASAWIWRNDLSAPTLVGEVETVRANVASVQPGTLVKLNVGRFSPVRAGEIIAEVLVCDPRYLESVIGVARAETEVLRLQLDPVVTQERSKVDYQRLRLEVLDQKVQLASAQMQLRYAEAEYDRVAALRASGPGSIASRNELEIALRDRDALRGETQTRQNLVQELEASMGRLRVGQDTAPDAAVPPGWKAALELQEQRLKQAMAEFGPVSLPAPIDGTVSTVYRRSGENVGAGEPIVTITSSRSDRILAYVMPPWREEPTVGMTVEVRSRSGNRPKGRARVVEVARHLDFVIPTLAQQTLGRGTTIADRYSMIGTGGGQTPPQVGLPVAISVPPELKLLPGEVVDLRLVLNTLARTERSPVAAD